VKRTKFNTFFFTTGFTIAITTTMMLKRSFNRLFLTIFLTRRMRRVFGCVFLAFKVSSFLTTCSFFMMSLMAVAMSMMISIIGCFSRTNISFFFTFFTIIIIIMIRIVFARTFTFRNSPCFRLRKEQNNKQRGR
jgi:magnesium-transporting ATPase (P-type)